MYIKYIQKTNTELQEEITMKRKNVESLLMAAALAMAAPSVLPAAGEAVQVVAEAAEEALEGSAVEVSAATLDGWVKRGKDNLSL